MILDDLLNCDSELELVHCNDKKVNILGITDNSEYLEDHILFIRDLKFFKKIIDELPKLTSLGLVIDKKFYEDHFPAKLKNKYKFELVSADIPMSICKLSKVFYDAKFGEDNEQVDGRQMGTADIHPTALISQGVFLGENVKIGKNVRIYSGAVIGSHCEIGEGSEIFSNVSIYHNVKIGNYCRIHSGTNIGTDGYGYNYKNGVHEKIYHVGGVVIDDNVEIGSGTSIDCGTFSPTRIGAGTKLDNLVHIAHNVKLGKGVLLCGEVGIGGSSVIGDYCVFGGMSGMADNLVIGNACEVAGGAKITGNWPDNSKLGGYPARSRKDWLKGLAYIRKLTK